MTTIDHTEYQQLGTLIDVLRLHAARQPEALAYHYIDNALDGSGTTLTYRELDERARRLAAHLRRVAAKDDRILLFFPAGLDYIVAFLGCLYAGVIAVPLYPPRKGEKLDRIAHVVNDCGARFALGLAQDIARTGDMFAAGFKDLVACPFELMTLEQGLAAEPMDPAEYARGGLDVAFIQYTSGSTGNPKGVMVAHGNLLANQKSIADGFGSRADDVCLNWLPLYHDMGLIGTTLHPLYCGYPAYILSPLAFIQDPLCWLENIGRFGATVAGGPNFCFELCVKHAQAQPERAAALRLDSWRVAFNGAEPIHALSMQRFAQSFRGQGFDGQSFYPCYGLAEATLYVTGSVAKAGFRHWRADPDALADGQFRASDAAGSVKLVSSGTCADRHVLCIVDRQGHPVAPGQVGEIWVSGPSVSSGYWNQDALNQAIFRAQVQGGQHRGLDFLRTGDLGCMHEGELIVTGRAKDLIILNGRNYYPQDIEAAAGSAHPALRAGCTAAFSLDAGPTPYLVVVQEVDRKHAKSIDTDAAAKAVRLAIAKQYDIAIDEIVFIMPATIPKTSSGKIRRTETRLRYQQQDLAVIRNAVRPEPAAPAASGTDLAALMLDPGVLGAMPAQALPGFIEVVLRRALALQTEQTIEAIGADHFVTGLGLDSMGIVAIQHSFEKALGIRLDMEALFKGITVRELALAMATAYGQRPTAAAAPAPRRQLEPLALSHSQQQLWFSYQLDPARSDYNLALLVECTPGLDRESLVASLDRACARHPILRTTYQALEHGNVQITGDSARFDFAELALDGAGEAGMMARLDQVAARPFDLEQGPVLRARLVTFSEQRCWLLLSVHHIASDFWSMVALADEVITEASGGVVARLPHKSYQDWALEQAQYLRSDGAQADQRFWQRVLSGKVLSSALPQAFGAGATAPSTGCLNFRIDADLMQRAEGYARQRGKTLNAVCMAVFQLLLHLRSGQQKLAVGTMTAGRPGWEYEYTQGYFVNPIVVPSEHAHADSFNDFLERAAGALAEGIAHQAYPFPLLVREHASSARSEQHPFFQAVFLMQQAHHLKGVNAFAVKGVDSRTTINGVALRALPVRSAALPFELVLTMAATGHGIEAMLEHNSAAFGALEVAAFARQYTDLLAAVLHDPGSALKTLAQPGAAGAPAPVQARAGAAPGSLQACSSLVEAFARQVRLVPDNAAVTFAGVSLTYAELDARASRLAALLAAAPGFVRGTPVAILLERSADVIVSIVAVLKAGACYLPLDPHSPPERLQAILDDGAPAVLITAGAMAASFPALAQRPDLHLLALDALDAPAAPPAPGPAPVPGAADERAYVIFTSGSTGRPKGVQVTHANVLRLFTCCEQEFGFHERDVWTLFHSYAFDFSVWEIWGALLYGGRVVVVPYEVTRQPHEFYQLVMEEKVTVLNQTPSAFKLFCRIDAQYDAPLAHLRTVVFGGEALVFGNLQGWLHKYGDQRPQLVNMYGITETTVHVTYRRLALADLHCSSSLIGTPLRDLTIDLLDPQLRRVADGEIGEMVVGGAGVALGYLGNPGLTGERFVELELDPGARRRYYRSGDLARRVAGGEYEYLGRQDHQVNINGFRIELGEIESALVRFAGIREALVVADAPQPKAHAIVDALPRAADAMTNIRQLIRSSTGGPGTGAAKLVAYVVCDAAPDMERLHQHLSALLPDYMVPGALIPVAAIPLNHNGKADVKQLALEARGAIALRAAYVAPRNDAERVFARLFADILDCPRVGAHDGFFELGGDSIRIIQLRSKALKAGLQVSVQDVFRLQTPAALAAAISTGGAIAERTRLAPFAQVSGEERAMLPAGVVDAYPLARLQEGLLFHSLYGSDIAMYCDIFEFRLRAPFDPAAFDTAVQALVARHPIFRTSFHFGEFERPLQLVHAHAHCRIALFDYRGWAPQAQQSAYQQWLEAEKRAQYDVASAGLIRFSLHRLGDDEFTFTMSFHDALLDGWSESSTISEVLANYFEAMASGTVAPKPAIGTTFSDFVGIEQEAIDDPAVAGFWKAELDDIRPTELPRWHNGPVDTHQQNDVRFFAVELAPALSDELKALARQLGVSLKHVLLAAHAAVISYVSGEADIVLAVESNGRLDDGDGEKVFGTHLNVVPWRLKLEAGSWETLIRTVQEKEAQLQPYRRYPYQEIQRLKGNERLFDVSFNYTHFHVYEELEQLTGLTILDAKAYIQTHFAMRVEFNQDPFTKHLTLDLEANVNDIAPEQVKAIGRYFIKALTAIAAAPRAMFTAAQLMSDEELRVELAAAHGPLDPGVAHSACLYMERFDRQAASSPDGIAATDAQGSITYGELMRRSCAAARQLRADGVKQGDVVAILADRSIGYLGAILAIWRLGAVFIPLPNGPVDRLDKILARAGAGFLLFSAAYGTLQRQVSVALRAIGIDGLGAGAASSALPNCALAEGDLAYMIFTSGSTGEPKGVMIEHGGMINHMEAKIAELGIGARDILSQDAAATFDICVWQFCAPLLVGGAVRIFEDEIAKDPGRLLQHVMQERISLLEVAPSVLSTMLFVYQSERGGEGAAAPHDTDLASLRWVVSSGETLQPSLVRQLRAICPHVEILNMWGATETSDDCTHYRVPFEVAPGIAKISIGQPIRNAAVYVLDAWRRLAPAGTPGDLYVGGLCVGRGYVNDAERSAAAFLDTAIGYGDYPRLYRSGDRGLRAPGGQLFFIGRRDDQVKVRGHRIEIGEVEAALNRQPGVQEAVVLALPDSSGQLALFAWVVPVEQEGMVFELANAPSVRPFRALLKEQVPAYMIPDTIVLLPQLPKNVNGKVDRKALVVPDAGQQDDAVALIAPANATEQAVLALFQQILKKDAISTDWSFFDLGGNSLLATQLISRAKRTFARELAVRALFEHDTIATFAAFLAAGDGAPAARDEIRPGIRDGGGAIALSFNQERIWFLGKIDSSGRAYNSHFALRIKGDLDGDALEGALQSVVDRHEILRTAFVDTGAGPVQVVAPHMRLGLVREELGALAGDEREAELMRRMSAQLDSAYRLDALPLCGATLYRLGAHEHVLLWRNHHIIGDGWSASIMLREMEQLYGALTGARSDRLPPLPIQFADYAMWQREYVQSPRFAHKMAFWQQYLEGHVNLLSLPTDFERPKHLSFEGKRIAVEIPEALTIRIRQLCKQSKATLFAFLQSALGLLFSRYSKENDLLIGTVVANRQLVETEALIGFFTNTLPVRHRFDQAASFVDHLVKVNDELLNVFDNQDVPFAHLVQRFVHERDASANPLVQVMLVLQNEDLSLPAIDGLRFQNVDVDRSASIMDMLFDLQEIDRKIAGHIEYNVNLFAQQTVASMWTNLLNLINSIVAASDEPIATLSTLGPSEHELLSKLWRTVQRGRSEIRFWDRQAMETPYWDSYLEQAEENGLLMSAYLAVSGY